MLRLDLNVEYRSIKSFVVDFDLPELTIIVGKNGSGKTHVLEAIQNESIACELKSSADFVIAKARSSEINLKNCNDIFQAQLQHQHDVRSETQMARLSDPLYHYLSQSFYQYAMELQKNIDKRKFQQDNFVNTGCLSDTEFEKKFGEPPWQIVNTVLKKFGFKFKIEEFSAVKFDRERLIYNPDSYYRNLVVSDGGDEFSIKDLSSGEKVILSLILAGVHRTSFENPTTKVFLLDEVDNALHPALIPVLLDLIRVELIQKRNYHVILTTHSPTTVALANDGEVFKLDSPTGQTSGLCKVDRKAAIAFLTSELGLLDISYAAPRFIITESSKDAKIYNTLWSFLRSHLNFSRELVFIGAGGQGDNGKTGCAAVRSLVNQFETGGNETVYGLIDFDGHNYSQNRIYVATESERYSIENIILDPISIAIFIALEYQAKLPLFNLAKYHSIDQFLNADLETHQDTADKIVDLLLPAAKGGTKRSIQLLMHRGSQNSIAVNEAWLKQNGHELGQKICENLKLTIPETKAILRHPNPEKNCEILVEQILQKVFRNFPAVIPLAMISTIEKLSAQ